MKEGIEAAACKEGDGGWGVGDFRKSFCCREEQDLMVTEAGMRRVRS